MAIFKRFVAFKHSYYLLCVYNSICFLWKKKKRKSGNTFSIWSPQSIWNSCHEYIFVILYCRLPEDYPATSSSAFFCDFYLQSLLWEKSGCNFYNRPKDISKTHSRHTTQLRKTSEFTLLCKDQYDLEIRLTRQVLTNF